MFNKKINLSELYCPGPKCNMKKRGDTFKPGSFFQRGKEKDGKKIIDALNYSLSGIGKTVKQGEYVCSACVIFAKRMFKKARPSIQSDAISIQPDATSIQPDTSSFEQGLKIYENPGYFMINMENSI